MTFDAAGYGLRIDLTLSERRDRQLSTRKRQVWGYPHDTIFDREAPMMPANVPVAVPLRVVVEADPWPYRWIAGLRFRAACKGTTNGL